MNVYLISTPHNGYDTYDSAVVIAESEDEARTTHPSGRYRWSEGFWRYTDTAWAGQKVDYESTWVHPDKVRVELIARNVDKKNVKPESNKVICASYNAG